jgi:putative uncharacterized protein (fragment)
MAEKKKRCQYLVVFDWMYDNFGFNVSEANALAVVYGFCQDGKSWYQGGSTYLAERLHISQKSAKNYLANFVKIGILKKGTRMVGKVAYNIYQTVPDIENLVLTDEEDPGKIFPSEKISPVKNLPSDPGKIFPQTRVNFSHKKEIENKKEKSIYQREAPKTDGLMDSETVVDETRERFREQLELDTLALRYDSGELEELEDAIVDMYTCPEPYQQIGQQLQSTKAVRQMLDKLTSQHIEYIMESLSNTTQPIKNIRSYLRVTILRAPTTVEHYYKAQANAAVARAPHPAGPSAEKLAATLRRIQKRGDGA